MTSADAVLVRVAWTPGRAEPSHRSELVTQWLCGERLDVREVGDDDWLRIAGPDGYASWVDGGGVLRVGAGEADRWEREADWISLGTGLRPPGSGERAGEGPGPAGGGTIPPFLPWGARVSAPKGGREPAGAERRERVRLPDGEVAETADPDGLVAREERVLRFPPRADALLATASEWMGVPYLWGGRTREGADCSGYVQAVLALHGRRLPRDSGLQLRADELVWRAPGPGEDAGGDRLLSAAREVLRPGDLLFFGDAAEAGIDAGPRADRGVGESAEGVTHVAFCAEDTRILHAAAGRGRVTADDLAADDPLMARLRDRLVAVTRPLARAEGPGTGG